MEASPCGWILHGVADDVGDLDEAAVVLLVQRPQDAALHRLQAVRQVGDGAVADDVGGVVEEAAVHAAMQRQLDLAGDERPMPARAAATVSARTCGGAVAVPCRRPLRHRRLRLAAPRWLSGAAFGPLLGVVVGETPESAVPAIGVDLSTLGRRHCSYSSTGTTRCLHDVILALRRVLAHVESPGCRRPPCLGAYSTWLRRMSWPMNCLNSAGEISPRPLNRVISGLPPSFFTACVALGFASSSRSSVPCCARGTAAFPGRAGGRRAPAARRTGRKT